MQQATERCRVRVRRPDKALYIPIARRGVVLIKSGEEGKSRDSPDSTGKEEQKEDGLSQKEIFRDKPETERLNSNPDKKEHNPREGKKSSTKLRKDACLKERKKDRVCAKRGGIESKEVFSQVSRLRDPNPGDLPTTPLQMHCKPEKTEGLVVETAVVAEREKPFLSQPLSESSESEILNAPFQNVKICDNGRHDLSGEAFEDRDLESKIGTGDVKIVEILSQFPEVSGSDLRPEGMTKLGKPGSGSGKQITGGTLKFNGRDITVIPVPGSLEVATDQASPDFEVENAGESTDVTDVILGHKDQGSIPETVSHISPEPMLISQSERANGTCDPTVITEDKENDGVADELPTKHEPSDTTVLAHRATGNEPKSLDDTANKACAMGMTDVISDQVTRGSPCLVAAGTADETGSNTSDFSKYIEVSADTAPFPVAGSQNATEGSRNPTACPDIYGESISSSFTESTGKLTESLSDCASSLPIKKIAGSNCNTFLDSELSMLNGTKVLSESALGNDLDCTDDITEASHELKTAEEFKTQEEDVSGNIELDVSFANIESGSMDTSTELRAAERAPVEEEAAEESWESMFNDDGDCLDPRLLQEIISGGCPWRHLHLENGTRYSAFYI